MTPHENALQLHALGLNVMKVPVPRRGVRQGLPGDGKSPAMPWCHLQTRRQTVAEVMQRFCDSTPTNIAVITGAVSNVVVIDADSPEAVRWCTTHLPYTPWQTKTRRGFHLWYAHPGVRVANRSRIETRDGLLALDCRGDGGYVIAWDSLHASGVQYQQAGDWTVPHAELPRFWPGWIARALRPSSRPNRPRPGNLVERARRYLDAVPRPEIGYGSDTATLYAACRLVRGFGLTLPDAETLLWEWAGNRPGWTRDWIGQKVHHAARYGSEPIGALR